MPGDGWGRRDDAGEERAATPNDVENRQSRVGQISAADQPGISMVPVQVIVEFSCASCLVLLNTIC